LRLASFLSFFSGVFGFACSFFGGSGSVRKTSQNTKLNTVTTMKQFEIIL